MMRFPGRGGSNEALLFNIGEIYELAGEIEKSKEIFRSFLEIYPASPANLEKNPPDLLPGLARIKLGLDPWGGQPKPTTEPTTRFFLSSHPNPFNSQTFIEFGLPKPTFVKLEVYNILGQRIKTLVKGDMEAGRHLLVWSGKDDDGNGLSSGLYFCRLRAGQLTSTGRMLLLR